jgi:hypothetical protein
MSADILTLPPRRPREPMHPHIYSAVLIRDDVTLGELMAALRFTGIVVSTHPESGQTYIHRAPTPNNAA